MSPPGGGHTPQPDPGSRTLETGKAKTPEREPDVSMVIEYVKRVGGPMYKTHHWHANAWVDHVNVCDVWCYTRAVALDEAEAALNRAGLGFGETHHG